MSIKKEIISFFKDPEKVDNGYVKLNDDGSIYVDSVFSIDALIEAIGLKEDKWQPIETVPKDRYVLLYEPEIPTWAGNMEVAKWFVDNDGDGCFWSCGGPNGGLELDNYRQFTHWRLLPNPPSPAGSMEDGTK